MFQPQPFGKYTLFDKIAVGGMAEIYLAKAQSRGEADGSGYLVIKRILPHFSGNSQFVDMFIDEAKISAQLRHENIVPLYDLGKVGESYFLAMEWVTGQDLKAIGARCREKGLRLSFEHSAFIVSELLQGLDYAHNKADASGRPLQIVHRDVSPQNVMVGYDGRVKVTDFGIAKAESKLDATAVGTLKGKFGYMAPEQVFSSGQPLDARADLFAAGIILWESITGHRLFDGRSEIEILEKVRGARIEPPSGFVPDVPRDLEKIVFRALMKDRDRRYGNCAEMREDLVRFLEGASASVGQLEMAEAMQELFGPEIDTVRTRWKVDLTVVDLSHVDEGARLEASRPDARTQADPPDAHASPPQTSKTILPVPTAPRLEAGDLFDEAPAGIAGQDSPFEPDEEWTQTRESKRIRPPEGSGVSARPDPVGAAAGEDADPGKAAPRTSGAMRAFAGVGILAAFGAAIASLLLNGVIPNPFAPPMIEVVSTVDAVVRIDGNIVLASGNAGKWPVGPGERKVEVSSHGYHPLQVTVNAVKGKVRFVDAALKPLSDTDPDLDGEDVAANDAAADEAIGAETGAGTGGPGALESQAVEPNGTPLPAFPLDAGDTRRPSKPDAQDPPPKPSSDSKSAAVKPGAEQAGSGGLAGYLSLDVEGGWGEVWVDGVRIATNTPLVKAPLAAGSRTVRVVNPVTREERTIEVWIVTGKLTSSQVRFQ